MHLDQGSPLHVCKQTRFWNRGLFLSLRIQCGVSFIFNKSPGVQNLPSSPKKAKGFQGEESHVPVACDFGLGRAEVLGGSLIFFDFGLSGKL